VERQALGLIECGSLIAMIEAAHAAAKSANVTLVGYGRLGSAPLKPVSRFLLRLVHLPQRPALAQGLQN